MSNKYCINTVDYPVLSIEDTKSLLMEYRNGKDVSKKQAALDNLVFHNVGVIYDVINHVCKRPNPELFSFGVEGLISAINKYDLSKNANLGTYAFYDVFKCVLKGYNETTRGISIPDDVATCLSKFNEAMKEFEKTNGFTPSYRPFSDENNGIKSIMEELMSDSFDLNLYKRVVYAYETTFVSSLDFTIDDGEGSSIAFVDTIAAPSSSNENKHQSLDAVFSELRKNCKDGEIIMQIFNLATQGYKGPAIEEKLHISRSTYRTLSSRGKEFLLKYDSIREVVNPLAH